MLWYFTENKNNQTKGYRGRSILLDQDLNQLQEIYEKRTSTDLEELPRQLNRTENLFSKILRNFWGNMKNMKILEGTGTYRKNYQKHACVT